MKMISCRRCDSPFEQPAKNVAYCSDECRASARADQTRESWRKYHEQNRGVKIKRSQDWRKNNPEYAKHRQALRYGMTLEQYEALFASQGNRCAICKKPDSGKSRFWAIDHDHSCCPGRAQSCGKCVRGALCSMCNKGLGFFEDSVERLAAAIAYLGGGA